MRSVIAAVPLACALLLGAPTPASARHPRVAAEPVIARITDLGPTPVILRGADLSPRRAARATRLARRVYRDVAQRFLQPTRERHAPVDVCLFDDTTRYRAFVTDLFGDEDHSPWGFYVPSRRLVIANFGVSPGNLRHELAHALIGDDGWRMPAWLNEGIGSLYGTARARGPGLQFLVNYRLRHVKQARADGSVPSLDRLARSTAADVYGFDAMVYYGLSRYVLLYLDHRGELSAFYAELRAADGDVEAQRAALIQRVDEQGFGEWLDRLTLSKK